MADQPTIIVAGCTRSGLTMTMQMLHAGGIECLGRYPAFEDHGIGMIPWHQCSGKAVKLVDAHQQLPRPGNYRVIRLARDLDQQVASFFKFMRMFGIPFTSEPRKMMKRSFVESYKTIDRWVGEHPHRVLQFEAVIENPAAAAQEIADFIERPVDVSRMAGAVIARSPLCTERFYELEMVG